MKLSILLFAGAALCSTVLRAAPVQIYSNFGTSPDPLYGVASPLGIRIADAVPFVAPAPPDAGSGFSYALSDVNIVAYTSSLDANAGLSVNLYDSIGGLPGNVLEAIPADLSVFDAGEDLSTYFVHVSSAVNPVLVAGQQYWVGLSDTDFPLDVTWVSDGIGAGGAAKLINTDDGLAWILLGAGNPQGALQVNAIEVQAVAPEPGTFVGLGGGLVGIGLFVRRRKNRVL